MRLGCSQHILCSWPQSNRDFTQPEKVIRGTNKHKNDSEFDARDVLTKCFPGLVCDWSDSCCGKHNAGHHRWDSEKKLPSERQGDTLSFLLTLPLGAQIHSSNWSWSPTLTGHFQWQNQVVHMPHCFTLKINEFVTENTWLPQSLHP